MERLLLINSPICHVPGFYKVKRILPQVAKMIVNEALEKGAPIESYIGYEDTAKALSDLLGIEVPTNRGMFEWQEGDEAIVIKLKKRLSPEEKGHYKPSFEDFEFLHIKIIKKL